MDLSIERLGTPKIESPLQLSTRYGDKVCNYVPDDESVLYSVTEDGLRRYTDLLSTGGEMPTFERAGPREKIYFDPSKLRVGVVTCGGLCPGINNVIRALVMELHYRYGVRRLYGFRYGYEGLVPAAGHDVMDLTPDSVKDIHLLGGSVLGSSRGPQDVETMVDTLERMGIGLFFTIGGDGTLRGAHAIYEEVQRRGLKISVIGVPKTIDNDIQLVERTFGFETAFSVALTAIRSAHTEAKGYYNGLGLVRLMGRHSGYIAATAAVASSDVNCVLVPEVPFQLDGERGLISWLVKRFERSRHSVIVVAEGAGQDLLSQAGSGQRDASGNLKLGDIGLFLKQQFAKKLRERGVPFSLKYIDPSYIIRSAPPFPNDALFCSNLAQHAVHAGMSGRTGMLVGLWHNVFTHVPLAEAVKARKIVDPEGELWLSVLEATGQPVNWS